MRSFDMQVFHSTLDEERRSCGLSWEAMVDQINQPFVGTTSIPISVGTIRGMLKKRSVTSAVVLQALRWLSRSPESFLSPVAQGDEDVANLLPEPGSGRILRLDTTKLFHALDARRLQRDMTWRQVAEELPSFRESMLRNLKTGPLIGFPRVMELTQWTGLPAVTFVRDTAR